MYARRASTYKAPPPVGGAPVPDHWWKLNDTYTTQVPDDGAVGGNPVLIEDGTDGSLTERPTEPMSNGWLGAIDQEPFNVSTSNRDYSRLRCNTNPNFQSVEKVSLTFRCRRLSSYLQVGDQRLFAQANGHNESNHILMYGLTSNNSVFRARVRTSGSTATYVSSVSHIIDTNEFYGFVLDFTAPDGEELAIYKDGLLAENLAISGNAIDANLSDVDTSLGVNRGPTRWTAPFSGMLADFRLWVGRALTASEILDVYNDVSGT